MKYIEYNLTDDNGKSNCVIRTFSKIFNKSYKEILNDLIDTAKELGCESFNDIPVYVEYKVIAIEDNGPMMDWYWIVQNVDDDRDIKNILANSWDLVNGIIL